MCAGTGYGGRIAVGEILELTGEIKKAILERSDLTGIEDAARSLQLGKSRPGFETMKEKAMKKFHLGLTSLEEVTIVFPF